MPNDERPKVIHPAGGRLMTKQADALRSDINAIMARWIAHGQPPGGAIGEAKYGDFSNVDDYHSALNKIHDAEVSFLELPASIRKHVGNDPGRFLEMVYDPARKDELVQLGLLPKHEPAPQPPPEPDPPDPEPDPPE